MSAQRYELLLGNEIVLCDGGLETQMVFGDPPIALPEFASFPILRDEKGRNFILNFYKTYAEVAVNARVNMLFDSATWRASTDWGKKLGYNSEQLAAANRDAVDVIKHARDEYETDSTKFILSGAIGPRSDGYKPTELMTPEEAEEYHAVQIKTLKDAGVDVISSYTAPYVEEVVGMCRAAAKAGIHIIPSFTLETDGRLPSGMSLATAVQTVDNDLAEAGLQQPLFYGINCAHPVHFDTVLSEGAELHSPWLQRLKSVRANASTRSHAELDQCDTIDSGDPEDLGKRYGDLRAKCPHITLLGGCCGTDIRHLKAIAHVCVPQAGEKSADEHGKGTSQ